MKMSAIIRILKSAVIFFGMYFITSIPGELFDSAWLLKLGESICIFSFIAYVFINIEKFKKDLVG